jgi:hypothetical protein
MFVCRDVTSPARAVHNPKQIAAIVPHNLRLRDRGHGCIDFRNRSTPGREILPCERELRRVWRLLTNGETKEGTT